MDTSYQTLVLNRLWQPVNVVGVERAFGLLSLDHAQVIYAEDESFRVFNSVTWFEFCREIFALAGVSGVNVNPIATSEYPTRATRPAYSVLDNSKLLEDFGISLPHWKQSLAHCLSAEGPLLCVK